MNENIFSKYKYLIIYLKIIKHVFSFTYIFEKLIFNLKAYFYYYMSKI